MGLIIPTFHESGFGILDFMVYGIIPKKSQTGPTEWTPKPVYLIALVPYLGVRW